MAIFHLLPVSIARWAWFLSQTLDKTLKQQKTLVFVFDRRFAIIYIYNFENLPSNTDKNECFAVSEFRVNYGIMKN